MPAERLLSPRPRVAGPATSGKRLQLDQRPLGATYSRPWSETAPPTWRGGLRRWRREREASARRAHPGASRSLPAPRWRFPRAPRSGSSSCPPSGQLDARDGRRGRLTDADAAVNAIRRAASNVDLVVDFEHHTQHSKENTGQPAPAVGWSRALPGVSRVDGARRSHS